MLLLYVHKVFICMLLLESRSLSKLGSQEYNLFEELTMYLYGSKKERIVLSEPDNESWFQFIFSCFQNYEVSICVYVCTYVHVYVKLYLLHTISAIKNCFIVKNDR